MSAKQRVSVVIIFLNGEIFIRDTIATVFAQTYDNWELLLVDDGSTDGSTTIAREYAEQYPERVCYLEHDGHRNRGTSASRNVGISHARGEFIALLDADDIWMPNKLERQVAIMEAQPDASMVYGTPLYWHSWSGEAKEKRRDKLSGLGVAPNTLVKPPDLLKLSYPLGPGASPVLSDILFRTEMIARTGVFEENFTGIYQLYEDQVFLTKIYLSEPVYVAGECWTKYRQHKNSCVSAVTRSGQYHTVRLQFLQWLAQYLTQQKVKDRHVQKALQKALWPYRYPRLNRLQTTGKNIGKRGIKVARRIAQRGFLVTAPLLLDTRSAPPAGQVHFGHLRRLSPISRASGFDRGQPVDRFYIERFLDAHREDIHGTVLEVGDDTYTRKFGGDLVEVSDVLHISDGNPKATLVADLAQGEHIPSNHFDCIILTQTLQYIYDVPAAIRTLERILKPGGVVLATLPGLGPISRDDWAKDWAWGFTTTSTKRLFACTFPEPQTGIVAYGNVLTATAFLHGLAVQDLSPAELEVNDPAYPILITVRAFKAGTNA